MPYRVHHITRALLLASLALPAVALAQTSPFPDTLTLDQETGLRLAVTSGAELSVMQQPRKDPPPPPPDDRRRRRPSMVGYINDAGIQSQVRLRFDAGTGIDSVDRAEFFYAKCGCYRFLPADHPAFDPNAPGPGPGINTDMNFQQFYLQAEYAFSDRVSVYGELPVRWIQPQAFLPDTGSFGDQSGLSDLRAGAKIALVASDTQYVTLQLQGQFPSGDGL